MKKNKLKKPIKVYTTHWGIPVSKKALKALADLDNKIPVLMETMYFTHIYDVAGFKALEINPKRRHSCLRHGYWCWKNLFEHPLDIIGFIRRKK